MQPIQFNLLLVCGTTSGGDSSMVPYLARGASAVGVDGLFFETHFDPSIALSDGANMIKLKELEKLIEQIDTIACYW